MTLKLLLYEISNAYGKYSEQRLPHIYTMCPHGSPVSCSSGHCHYSFQLVIYSALVKPSAQVS